MKQMRIVVDVQTTNAKGAPRSRRACAPAWETAAVEVGSALYSDALKSYEGLDEFGHQVIDHAVAYVDGNVHTNNCENFWSLLKRSLKGTYVAVEPFHLFRYIDEQAFRYNNRNMTDVERFVYVMRHVIGRRLTYKELTGKQGAEQHG